MDIDIIGLSKKLGAAMGESINAKIMKDLESSSYGKIFQTEASSSIAGENILIGDLVTQMDTGCPLIYNAETASKIKLNSTKENHVTIFFAFFVDRLTCNVKYLGPVSGQTEADAASQVSLSDSQKKLIPSKRGKILLTAMTGFEPIERTYLGDEKGEEEQE